MGDGENEEQKNKKKSEGICMHCYVMIDFNYFAANWPNKYPSGAEEDTFGGAAKGV